ncbi:hypothetical protein Tco_0526733 [Tanacetum coccineum]
MRKNNSLKAAQVKVRTHDFSSFGLLIGSTKLTRHRKLFTANLVLKNYSFINSISVEDLLNVGGDLILYHQQGLLPVSRRMGFAFEALKPSMNSDWWRITTRSTSAVFFANLLANLWEHGIHGCLNGRSEFSIGQVLEPTGRKPEL